ncbi:MAG: hypothetical protein GC158_09205 [Cyanobacteria bacterium RI_101]|nr:hypothetical protein [Cyanobacteria bacterium RI_101]
MEPLNASFFKDNYCQHPPLEIKPTAAGYLLKTDAVPRPTGSQSWVAGFFGMLFLALFFWFFLIILLIFGVVLLLNGAVRRKTWSEVWSAVCLSPGELLFSHYPLRLGDSDRLTFRRRLQDNFWTKLFNLQSLPTPATLAVKLVCVERVSYTKGTDTIVETAVVASYDLCRQALLPGEREMNSHFDLDIPAHLPPSFEGKHNQIRWLVLVEQTLPNLMEPAQSCFTLEVVDA